MAHDCAQCRMIQRLLLVKFDHAKLAALYPLLKPLLDAAATGECEPPPCEPPPCPCPTRQSFPILTRIARENCETVSALLMEIKEGLRTV